MDDPDIVKVSKKQEKLTLIDGSKIITEALVQSGADVYIGYPITPSNLFYAYANERFPQFLAAPDEISAIQWMAGFSAVGKIPVSATAFPGMALMTESINMACMMELPMVLILSQRLGPSTGSATTGSQGDLGFVKGMISGGYPLPVFCPTNFEDCWNLARKSLETALKLRTPVILLTSKEMVMTGRSFDLSRLKPLRKIKRKFARPGGTYLPYKANGELVPAFAPLGSSDHQVRMTASTHDAEGMIRKNTPEALHNTRRLNYKIEESASELSEFTYDLQERAKKLVVTFGISSDAARDAVKTGRQRGRRISLLIIKTLIPLSKEVMDILGSYPELIFVEENLTGQLQEMIFGRDAKRKITGINKIGNMIPPGEILKEIL